MAKKHDSVSDILRVLDSENTVNTDFTTASTANASNVLGEINSNNQDDDLLQILNTNNERGARVSHRRSSILKVNEKLPDYHRTSVARRVSWAQTYQLKEILLENGTVASTNTASQELNKYGPDGRPAVVRKSLEMGKVTVIPVTNENAAPNVQSKEEGQSTTSSSTAANIPNAAPTLPAANDESSNQLATCEVVQKVAKKRIASTGYTKILSKNYDKGNAKDWQTVVNTAVNRLNLEIDPTTTDLNRIFDATNPQTTELQLGNSADKVHLNTFLKQFVEQPQPPKQMTKSKIILPKENVSASKVAKPTILNMSSISPIAGNVKGTNLHRFEDTMNCSVMQVCNSTTIAANQTSPEDYLRNMIKDIHQEEGEESMVLDCSEEHRKTIHDTTLMAIDMDFTSSSDEKATTAGGTKSSVQQEEGKDDSAFLARLKGDEESPINTDTLEFSFQLQSEQQPLSPINSDQHTQGLTAILAHCSSSGDKENDLPDLIPASPAVDAPPTTVQHTDLLNILPPGSNEAATQMQDTLLLPGHLTFGNTLEEGQSATALPVATTAAASSTRSSGLTMEMTDVVEGTFETGDAVKAFSIFKDPSGIDLTFANSTTNDALASVSGSQKENELPPQLQKPFTVQKHSEPATQDFTLGLTIDATMAKANDQAVENTNPFIQQLKAAKEEKDEQPLQAATIDNGGTTMELTAVSDVSSLHLSNDISLVSSACPAAALSIFKDPSMVASPEQTPTSPPSPSAALNPSEKLDFSLSDSLVDSQKENQVPFHLFQEKEGGTLENESLPLEGAPLTLGASPGLPFSPMKDLTMGVSMAINTTEQEPSLFPTSTAFDISLGGTNIDLPEFTQSAVSQSNTAEVGAQTRMENTSGATLANLLDGNGSSLNFNETSLVSPTKAANTCGTTENCMKALVAKNDTLGLSPVYQPKKSVGDSVLMMPLNDVSLNMSMAPAVAVQQSSTTGLFTDLLAYQGGNQTVNNDECHSPNESLNSTTNLNDASSLAGNVTLAGFDINGSCNMNTDNDMPSIKVDVYEFTKNMDTDEMNTEGEGHPKMPYVPTRPFLGKSASVILDEEMEFTDSVQGSFAVANRTGQMEEVSCRMETEAAVVEDGPKAAQSEEVQMEEPEVQPATAQPVAEEEKSKMIPPTKEQPALVEPATLASPRQATSSAATVSPPCKRPYDFTILDSQKSNKFARCLSTQQQTMSMRTSAFPLASFSTTSKLMPPSSSVPQSRIPVVGHRGPPMFSSNHNTVSNNPANNTTVSLRPFTGLANLCPMPNKSTGFGNQRTTTIIPSSVSKTPAPATNTKVLQVDSSGASTRPQIELDFNRQSRNASLNRSSLDDSLNDSGPLSSSFSALRVQSCIRKSIGVGLKERLIQKAEAMKLIREKTVQVEQEQHEEVLPPPVEEEFVKEPTVPVQVAPEPMPMEVANEQVSIQLDDDDKAASRRFSVKLRNSNAPVVGQPEEEEVVEVEEEEVFSEEMKAIDMSNFLMPNLSLDSDSGSSALLPTRGSSSDDLFNSQPHTDQQETNMSSRDMNQLIEAFSQSIHNATAHDEPTATSPQRETSPLNVTASPLNSTVNVIKRILSDVTGDFTRWRELMDDRSRLLENTVSSIEEVSVGPTAEQLLWSSIASLDIASMNMRIHKMKADRCVIRFLWGTFEVNINFGEETKSGSRSMTISKIVSLYTSRNDPHEVMRGLTERSVKDGDLLELRYREEHRPFLLLAHNNLTHRFDEELVRLNKKYTDATMLADLITELSNIASPARNLAAELRDLYSREFMTLLPSDEDNFRFEIRLLGVGIASHFKLVFTLPLSPLSYPFKMIQPDVIVPEKDLHLYPELDTFREAFFRVKPGEANYISRLIYGACTFIKAIQKWRYDYLKLQRQKADFEGHSSVSTNHSQ